MGDRINRMIDEFISRADQHKAVVGIYGLGNVGLPLSLTFVRKGFSMIGFDFDPAKVEQFN